MMEYINIVEDTFAKIETCISLADDKTTKLYNESNNKTHFIKDDYEKVERKVLSTQRSI